MIKATEKWIGELNDVLQQVTDLDVTERQRTTIRRALATALVHAEDELVSEYEHRNSGTPWGKEDLQILEAGLKNEPDLMSWKEEQILLDMLAQRLGRPEKAIKKKAIELGWGKKVDYWVNRSDH